MNLITKEEAKSKGLKRYFTGKPCRIRGHIGERLTYDGKCVLCRAVRELKRQITDAEKIKERRKRYRALNAEKIRTNKKKYEKSRINTPARKITKKKYKYRYERRALAAEGNFTSNDIETLFKNQDGHCLKCGIKFSEEIPYTIDHDIPLSRGGTNWPNNLNLLCRSCNSRKCNKTMVEFMCGGSN